jgi:2-polyprenyl-3-methyl-5-hydroxy-6-metoxy-1,4-benzoquinol methylase
VGGRLPSTISLQELRVKLEKDVLGTTICPTTFDQAARRHGRGFARYVFATQYAAAKRVIDAACGGGFGSAYLAERATSVLGLDLDDEMLRIARESFRRDNLEFRRHDLNHPIEPHRRFDLVTSFETLEHVRDPQQCLRNLTSVLADDGMALISVPNGDKELAAGDTKDYHERHFSAGEFETLLRQAFEEVHPHSQVYHKGLKHYACKLIGRTAHHADNYRFPAGFDPAAKTWLAVCRGVRRSSTGPSGLGL